MESCPKGNRQRFSSHSLSPLQSHCPQAAPASWHQWRWPSSWFSDNGDVVPQGLLAQCGTRTVSLAGWWLVAVSRAQKREYGVRGEWGRREGSVVMGPAEGPRMVCRDKADCCPSS